MLWSPSSDSVAFAGSQSRIDVYSLKNNVLTELPKRFVYDSLAWSPTAEVLAVYSAGKLYFYRAEGDKMRLVDDYRLGWGRSKYESALLSWHPSGRRLLVAPVRDNGSLPRSDAETFEINIDSRAKISLGNGYAVYGPDATWLLWFNSALIGRSGKWVVDRQTYVDYWDRYPSREDLKAALKNKSSKSEPMDDATRDRLELSAANIVEFFPGYGGSTLCEEEDDRSKSIASVGCLGEDGVWENRFEIAIASDTATTNVGPDATARKRPDDRISTDPTGTLFAVSQEFQKDGPTLRIYNHAGEELADGKSFLTAMRGSVSNVREIGDDNLIWSQDRRYLTALRNGVIYIWNWRTNKIRRIELHHAATPRP